MARKSRFIAYAKAVKKCVDETKKQEPVKAPAGVKGENSGRKNKL